MTASGAGIELYFLEGSFCLSIWEGRGKVTDYRLKIPIQPQKWYFMALSHEYKFLGRSEVKLLVGNNKQSFPVSFPKITDV